MKEVKIEIPQGYEVDSFDKNTGKLTFKEVVKDITERIKTLNDAVSYLGDEDEEVTQLKLLQSVVGLSPHVVSQQEAIVIVKSLNEKYVFDWKDSSEYKYQIWWKMQEDGFAYYDYNFYDAHSDVSARLCLKSRYLCEYIGKNKEFVKIFKSFMLQG